MYYTVYGVGYRVERDRRQYFETAEPLPYHLPVQLFATRPHLGPPRSTPIMLRLSAHSGLGACSDDEPCTMQQQLCVLSPVAAPTALQCIALPRACMAAAAPPDPPSSRKHVGERSSASSRPVCRLDHWTRSRGRRRSTASYSSTSKRVATSPNVVRCGRHSAIYCPSANLPGHEPRLVLRFGVP